MGVRYGKIKISDEFRVQAAAEIAEMTGYFNKLDAEIMQYEEKLKAANNIDGLRTLAIARTNLEIASQYANKTISLNYEETSNDTK